MTTGEYTTGLTDCFGDMQTSLYGCFCPCCLSGKNMARLMNEDFRCVYGFCCPSPFWTRRFIRLKYNIEPDEKGDCIAFTFCTPCGICQDAREIENREKDI